MNDELIDHLDYKQLLISMIDQAMDDYIKLMHPAKRRKTYMTEAFEDAVDMFFDPSYQIGVLQNDENQDMSLKDIIEAALDLPDPDVRLIQKHIIKAARDFWITQRARTVYVPSMLCVAGEVWETSHDPEVKDYVLDYEAKTITLNKLSKYAAQQALVSAVITVTNEVYKLDLKPRQLSGLSDAWFEVLKVNDAFRVPIKTLLAEEIP